MKVQRLLLISLLPTIALGTATFLRAQKLPSEPLHDAGQSITGAFEGWFQNQDGSFSILLGYYNRNQKQELDIPIGPNNRIEPGDPDQGQPTHFLPGRQWGVFVITVPKDFGSNKLIWTLVANGQTAVIPANLDPLWEISPFLDATGMTPPSIRFEGGASVRGPRQISTALSTTVANPLTLKAWVSDEAKIPPGMQRPKIPPVILTWSKFRGSGVVMFTNAKPPVEEAASDTAPPAAYSGVAATTATFSEPGEYVLRVVANNWSAVGVGGFPCCWTNAEVRVSVKP
jgi:hypothetical protein